MTVSDIEAVPSGEILTEVVTRGQTQSKVMEALLVGLKLQSASSSWWSSVRCGSKTLRMQGWVSYQDHLRNVHSYHVPGCLALTPTNAIKLHACREYLSQVEGIVSIEMHSRRCVFLVLWCITDDNAVQRKSDGTQIVSVNVKHTARAKRLVVALDQASLSTLFAFKSTNEIRFIKRP